MKTAESILLATDLRPSSRQAADVAVRLARRLGARISLLHVLEPVPGWPMSVGHTFDMELHGLRELVEHLTAENVPVAESAIVIGPPADTILRKAQEIDADLILIGAGDALPSDGFAIGPVAQAIVEHAAQPVLAVHPGAPPVRFEKVLCPVDHSPAAWRGLRNAVRLTQAFGGELIVLTVVPALTWLSAAVETGQLADARAAYARKWQEEFEHFLAGCDFGTVRWSSEVCHGTPHEEILAAVARHETDILVLGATGRSGLVRVLLGSVTRRVLRQLPCSLLTVKEEDVVGGFDEDVRAVTVLTAQGQGLLAAQSYDAAVDKFRLALRHHAFHAPALQALAEALAHLGQEEEAQFYRHRAEVLRGLGWI